MTSKFSRSALIAAFAVGASGLVAVPAAEAVAPASTYYVNQPTLSGASKITPESADISGLIDTGGSTSISSIAVAAGQTLNYAGPVSGTGVSLTGGASTATSYPLDGGPLALPDINGNQVDTYSAVVVEYDPLKDYQASGDVPGPETQFAPEDDVTTNTDASTAVNNIEIGAYPASKETSTGQQALTPNTKYVYWIEQQPLETTAATNFNAYSSSNLASWFSNPVASAGTGIGDFGDWLGGTNAYASVGGANMGVLASNSGLTNVPNDTSLENPDWSCTLDYNLSAASAAAGWLSSNGIVTVTDSSTDAAEVSAGLVPAAASNGVTAPQTATDGNGVNYTVNLATATSGATAIANTTPIYGIANAAVSGTTATIQPVTAQQAALQSGSCVDILGGTNNWYTSQIGEFTTAKIGSLTFGTSAKVSGKKATATVKDRSNDKAAGSVELTAKVKGKKVEIAKGTFKVSAENSGKLKITLTKKGSKDLLATKSGKIKTTIKLTSKDDQPTKTKAITLKLA